VTTVHTGSSKWVGDKRKKMKLRRRTSITTRSRFGTSKGQQGVRMTRLKDSLTTNGPARLLMSRALI
jgi:hypothetical protein